jgi:hypothetical protein
MAIGITSTGSAKLPSVLTSLDASAIHTKRSRLRRHDFLARQRSTSALDHVAVVIDFVGTIDVHRQGSDIVALEYGIPAARSRCAAGHGAGHRTLDGP